MSSLDPRSALSQHVLECLTELSYHAGDLDRYLTELVLGVSRLIQSDWSIVTICEGDTGRVIASSLDTGQGDSGFSVHGTLVEEVVISGRSLIVEDIAILFELLSFAALKPFPRLELVIATDLGLL